MYQFIHFTCSMENRRQFTRILFSIDAQLEVDEKTYAVNIHDISLNGALVSAPKTQDDILNKLGVLHFNLNETPVSMHVAIVHVESEEVGLRCNAIDIDSVTHLRRLVELNLGDDSQLHKELSQLTRTFID
ncbi:PilZ domain-containing protein [Thalassotalea hakodatensis]|uniref:PilZ domain-containing protein n=1 Tax=Thalassotalea hakodatensis TaxID=3030492 RepID=UPI002573AE05|nr:PilZ domain-containing protein [Thalassotalea hakodatensis]